MGMHTAPRVLAAAVALAAAASTAPAPAAAAPRAAPASTGAMTIDRTASLAPDGTVTMTGTYRCTVTRPAGLVVVGSNVIQGARYSGIGGSTAVCDGKEHRWRNTARPAHVTYQPGPARADGTLMQFRRDKTGIPLPYFLAVVKEQDITLVTRG